MTVIWGCITLVLVAAIVSIGIMERILWILAGILIVLQYLKEKKRRGWSKDSYKKIFLGVFCGYSLSILCLGYFQYQPYKINIAKNYVSQGKTAIILVVNSEPPHYNLPLLVRNYREVTPLWHRATLPFHLFRNKLDYEKTDGGLSYHYGQKLQYQLTQYFQDKYSIYIAYSHTEPYVEEAIHLAMAEGNQSIILTPVLLTESEDFKDIENKVTLINPSQYRVESYITKPLWESETVATSFVDQVNHYRSSRRKENVGIVLLGQEVKRGEEASTHIKQGLLFRHKVKDFLIDDGYDKNKVRLTSFDRKNLNHEIKALLEYGVGEIIVVPTAASLQCIEYQLALEEAIKSVKPRYTVKIHAINPWNYNTYIKEELLNRIKLLKLSI